VARIDVRLERLVVNAVQPYTANKRVQSLQRSRIAVDASLPIKLGQVPGRGFSEFSSRPVSVDRGLSDVLDFPREVPFHLLPITSSSAS
jgi:hypothetical protein